MGRETLESVRSIVWSPLAKNPHLRVRDGRLACILFIETMIAWSSSI
jgi:hypothetical protein